MNADAFNEINHFEAYRTPTEVQEVVGFVVFCTADDGAKTKQ